MTRILLFATATILLCSAGCSETNSPPVSSSAENGVALGAARSGQLIKLTPAAVVKLRDAQASSGLKYVRVSVQGGGCSGFIYDMKLDDTIDPDADLLVAEGGVNVVVDKRSSLFLAGSTIDFHTTVSGEQGFVFDNPNAIKTPE